MNQNRSTAGENMHGAPHVLTGGRIRRRIMVAWLLPVLLLGALPVAAQICETPLFIQEGQVEANVMILFDNSGSMNEAMYHMSFDPYTSYTGGYTQSKIYYISTSKDYVINGRTAYLTKAPGGYSGRYIGNYLNWIYWHASDEERADIPRVTRMHVAHEVVIDIIDRSEGVRFGLANFYTDNGGYIKASCGTSKFDLISKVNSIYGTTWTPLAETMEDVLDYFKETDKNAPIQAKCQKNFQIVMTDGFPTKDLNVSAYLHDADQDGNDPGSCASIGSIGGTDCSDHMDDVAYYARNNDLRSDLGEPGESANEGQHLVTYTIGFGIDAYLLHETAVNGDGLYLMAQNAAELWTSLELIMLDIISRISTGAAVAVVSTERGDQDYLYRGKFMPGDWAGFLEAFELPYETGDAPVWEAGHQLAARSSGDRRMFTAIGTNMYNWDVGQAGNVAGAMGAADAGVAADLITWSRGDDVYPYRLHDNGWKLGDIIHSTPVVVGAPNSFTEDEDYQSFMNTWVNREKVVYVGGNDGMLHSFRAADGHEKWAFVPEFALPMIQEMADTNYCHKYTCDLTPSVTDVRINGSWRTVLVSGGREGGASYFALDITNPDSPSVMWQATLPNGAAFASEVEFATIDNRPVALIGSGLDDIDGSAWLYEYDLSDGSLLGGLELSNLGMGTRNKATAPSVVDRDLDGNSDIVYVADMSGALYRIDLDQSTNVGSWDVSELYSGSQPITARPIPAYGESGMINVYVGTGAYLDKDDISTTDLQSFYCIFDRHDGNESPSLVDQTKKIQEIGSADGWFIDLEDNHGERITEPAAVVAGSVFYSSYMPSQEPCEAGGHSWLTRVAYADGSVPDDGEEDDFNGERRMDMGDGIASRPVVDIVNEDVIVQSSDATITIQAIGQTFFHLNVRSWQETYEHVTDVN